MPVTGFKMKSFGQILASLINWFSSAQSEVTDFNAGSVARTLLEAPASEIAEIYYRIFSAIDAAQAEAVYRSFGFDRKPAQFSAGVLLWQRTTLPTSPISIPPGSQAAVPANGATPDITFSATDLFVIPNQTTLAAAITSNVQTTITLTSATNVGAGDVLLVDLEKLGVVSVAGSVVTVTRGYGGTTATTHSNGAAIGVVGKAVTMQADLAGASGNVNAHTITKINTPIAGITTVDNPAAFSGGADEETDDQRKKRFEEFITALARGTKGAIEFGAKQVQGVVKAKAIDLDDPGSGLGPGFVNLYISDAAGTASGPLIAAVVTEEENWRPAGVSLSVFAPTITSINVTAALKIDPTFSSADVIAAVQQRLTDFITALEMGDSVYVALLYQTVVDTNPAAILNANITVPSADVTIDAAHIARPGTFSISVM